MERELGYQNRIVGHGTKPASQFQAHPNNWRKHPKNQRSAVKGSLESLGWVAEVIENKTTGRLIDGHERVWNALQNGDADVPFIQVELTEAEEAQALLSLDAIAALAETDREQVDALLKQVETDNADVMQFLTDFAKDNKLDWNQPEQGDAEPQIDRAAELLEKWKVETGDLWQIGEHRLLCGDSTKREDVERVMGGEKAQMCFTSPPYADQREYKKDGDLSPEHLSLFISSASEFVDCFCVNLGIKREAGEIIEYWQTYIKTAKDAGLKLLAWNVWDKGRGGAVGAMTAMFPLEHEFIFVFGEKKIDIELTVPNQTAGNHSSAAIMNKDGSRAESRDFIKRDYSPLGSVYRGRQVDKNDLHPAMFPLDFANAYISSFTGIVYEPFAGSGTTMVACQNLSRKCRAIEISPAYISVILERMSTAFPGIEIHRANSDA